MQIKKLAENIRFESPSLPRADLDNNDYIANEVINEDHEEETVNENTGKSNSDNTDEKANIDIPAPAMQ